MNNVSQIISRGPAKVTKTLDMSHYHKNYQGLKYTVWVNLPAKLKNKYSDIQDAVYEKTRLVKELTLEYIKCEEKEKAAIQKKIKANQDEVLATNKDVWAFYAEVWDQKPEDVEELHRGLEKSDPALWSWLSNTTWNMINDHLRGFKKN